jgi:hypothetical protein
MLLGCLLLGLAMPRALADTPYAAFQGTWLGTTKVSSSLGTYHYATTLKVNGGQWTMVSGPSSIPYLGNPFRLVPVLAGTSGSGTVKLSGKAAATTYKLKKGVLSTNGSYSVDQGSTGYDAVVAATITIDSHGQLSEKATVTVTTYVRKTVLGKTIKITAPKAVVNVTFLGSKQS